MQGRLLLRSEIVPASKQRVGTLLWRAITICALFAWGGLGIYQMQSLAIEVRARQLSSDTSCPRSHLKPDSTASQAFSLEKIAEHNRRQVGFLRSYLDELQETNKVELFSAMGLLPSDRIIGIRSGSQPTYLHSCQTLFSEPCGAELLSVLEHIAEATLILRRGKGLVLLTIEIP